MKKWTLIFAMFLSVPNLAFTQIIMANPNSNNVSQPAVNETVKRDVAFRLSNFDTYIIPIISWTDEGNDNGTTLTLPMKEFDLGKNVKENSFVAPENGIYHFDILLNFSYATEIYNSISKFKLMLCKNPGIVMEKTYLMNSRSEKPFPPFLSLAVNTTLMLTKGEVVYASFNGDAQGLEVPPAQVVKASFSGFKVCSIEGDVIPKPVIK
jgi:hypothetical protein